MVSLKRRQERKKTKKKEEKNEQRIFETLTKEPRELNAEKVFFLIPGGGNSNTADSSVMSSNILMESN